MKHSILILLATTCLIPAVSAQEPSQFTGKVIETMDTGGYTYVHIDTGTRKFWAAAPQVPTKVGEKVTVSEGMPMKDYTSKTLNRKFDLVYFVGAINKGDQQQVPQGMHPKIDAAQSAKNAKVSFSDIKKADKTVGEIYAEQANLGNKEVAVRGKVVKFNAQIMGKNWVHVQDGTGKEGSNDLTVTTADRVKVGDTVLVNGKIALKKDFGMGYKYDLIIEDGKVKAE